MNSSLESLSRLVNRVQGDPFYLAAAFSKTRAARGWTKAQLQDWLGCDESGYVALSLCRLPKNEADLDRLATRFGVDRDRLREVTGDG